LIRILGRSEMVEVDGRAASFFANGNNIIIVGELCRRVVRCRLDSKMENPEKRVFASDPIAAIREDRGAYVSACLTICRAYAVAEHPGKLNLGSFSGWSATVRSALMWLDKEDPVKSMDTIKAEDPETEALKALLTAWVRVIGTGYANRMELKTVVEMANEMSGTEFKHLDLHSAVRAVMSDKRKPLDSFDLGKWMQKKRERVVDGMRFYYAKRHWHVELNDGTVRDGEM
jgi:hypothetical protein